MQFNVLDKFMRYRLSKEMIILFLLSLIVGFITYGYIIVFAMLGYLFLRENEEKYLCIVGYFMAVLIRGLSFSYEQVLIVSIYFGLLLGLHMFLHNPSSFVYIGGFTLLGVYLLCIKEYPINYIVVCLSVFLLIAYELRSLLFDERQAFIFLISLICNCMVLRLTMIDNETIKIVLLVTLVVEAMYLDLKPYIILYAVTAIIYSLSFILPVSFVVVLLSVLLSKESKLIAVILYVMVAYGMDLPMIEIIILTGCFLSVYNMTFEKYIPSATNHNNQSSIVLLERLADICKEFKDDERMASFEMVLRSSKEELQKLNEEHIKSSQIKDILRGYYYDVIDVDISYNSALYINLKLNDIHKYDIKEEIIPILSNYLKTPVYLMEYAKANMLHSYHECTLVVYPYIKVKYDYWQNGKDKVCGDYIMALRQQEQQLFILSDGMGYGVKAKEQSSMVAKILMELTCVKMPFMSVLRLMNEILLARQLDSYATLDLLCVDTILKQAYLYKAGSFDTYLVRNNKVYSFMSDSIPLGIVSKIDVNVYSFKVHYDDVIVMVSDGFEHKDLKQWILDNVSKSTSMMVKNICSEKEKVGIDDDVSILVIRMENCFNFL